MMPGHRNRKRIIVSYQRDSYHTQSDSETYSRCNETIVPSEQKTGLGWRRRCRPLGSKIVEISLSRSVVRVPGAFHPFRVVLLRYGSIAKSFLGWGGGCRCFKTRLIVPVGLERLLVSGHLRRDIIYDGMLFDALDPSLMRLV